MRILIHGINFSPELTGIGKYSGELAQWLAGQGHEVRVVTAPPYYPHWRVSEGHSNGWQKQYIAAEKEYLADTVTETSALSEPAASRFSPVVVYRCPLWVPSQPSGLKRLLHLATFALSSFPVMLGQILWRADLVLVVEPPLFCAPQAQLVAWLSGAKAWLHIQDFEVDAAFDLGILRAVWLKQWVLRMERFLMRRFARVSSISPNMCNKLLEKGVDVDRVVLFPNWVDAGDIYPLTRPSLFRAELGVDNTVCVALYSGNMGEKQGLEGVIEVARRCAANSAVLFVLCGDGVARNRLMRQAQGLRNICWLELQPLQRLNELLNLADIHLLPQRAGVSDLVMPSKLLGMLASGRPVLAMAEPDTQLSKELQVCGKVVAPGDEQRFYESLIECNYSGTNL